MTMPTVHTSDAPNIEVLLATYNGERFLAQQIDSILAQDYPNLRILARDDGSNDNTWNILTAYQDRFPDRFRVLEDRTPTRHPKRNFERLMQAATSQYMAFADQDDVWIPQKLSLSMHAMRNAEAQSGTDRPVLVFTDLEVVDENLQVVGTSFWALQGIPGLKTKKFSRLMVLNTFTGCTGLINRALCDLALPVPDQAFMHDWWLMLVAASFGTLVPLPTQTVRYRQHGGNSVGVAKATTQGGLLPNFRQHAERRKGWEMTVGNAIALKERFGAHLPHDKLQTVDALIRCETSPSRIARVWTFLDHDFLYENNRQTLATLWYLWDMDAAKQARP